MVLIIWYFEWYVDGYHLMLSDVIRYLSMKTLINVTNLIMHLSHVTQYTTQNRNVQISVRNSVLWGMVQLHYEIYANVPFSHIYLSPHKPYRDLRFCAFHATVYTDASFCFVVVAFYVPCGLVLLPGARPTNDISIEFEIRPNLQCYGLKYTVQITTKFCTRHDSINVVTCAKFCCDRLSTF